jgi:hypothetical protein
LPEAETNQFHIAIDHCDDSTEPNLRRLPIP